jgi:CTP synthase
VAQTVARTHDQRQAAKHVFITGGVASALGKGITAASLGRLLKARGMRVTMLKLDPYLNVDPGTMNPFEHGEVFVTEDGGETDLDLGHYERFIDENLGRGSSVSSGQVWSTVIAKERRGDYLGKTVQVIPHVTDEIKRRILAVSEGVDVVITEVGGTVGDIEGLPFLEAIRQMRHDIGRENIVYVHCALVPYIAASGELKTKPAQHSVRELRSIGIQPDVVVLRSDRPLDLGLRQKVALQCDVDVEAVISAIDQASLYEVPLAMHDEGLDAVVLKRLAVTTPPPDLEEWRLIVARSRGTTDRVEIAIVGKYVELQDAYLSVVEAVRHGGLLHGVHVDLRWVAADDLEGADGNPLDGVDGVIVPGGFGVRGIDGKVAAIRFARESGVPFLGLCLGLQCAVIEFARNVAGLPAAHSHEFDEATPDPVIALMLDQHGVTEKGGTMRLGSYPALLAEGSLVRRLYGGAPEVRERHRHRYEVNNAYRAPLAAHGMRWSGTSPDGTLVEFLELPDHPFFVATQAHPELRSRPNRPHPLFAGLVEAAVRHRREALGRLPVDLADRVDEQREPSVGVRVEDAARA